MDKTANSLIEALASIPDNATAMFGGFGGSCAPSNMIHSLIDGFKTTGIFVNKVVD